MTTAPLKTFNTSGEIASDWIRIDAETAIPVDGQFILPLGRFLEAHSAGDLADHEQFGVLVDAGEDALSLDGKLDGVALIALNFPKFADGRSFSIGRVVRERLGFTGDMRAVGDVLIDQIPHMIRCGFSSFEVGHEPTQRRLAEGAPAQDAAVEVPNYYQPAGDSAAPVAGRAWARRRVQ